jgi:hypothetical protein
MADTLLSEVNKVLRMREHFGPSTGFRCDPLLMKTYNLYIPFHVDSNTEVQSQLGRRRILGSCITEQLVDAVYVVI